MSKPKVYFVAAEASGDVLAAEVIDQIRSSETEVEIAGIGGGAMANRGIVSPFDISELSVLGLIEGLKAYGVVKKRVEDAAQDILKQQPDIVVCVDSWGFTWRVASRIRELGCEVPRVKLIGPQVWATRPGRAKTLSEHFDHLLCIHAFEEPFYSPYGLETTVIGNPALSRLDNGNPDALRQKLNVQNNQRVLGLLLGSRPSEIKRVAPILVKATKQVSDRVDNLRIVCVTAGSVSAEVRRQSENWTFPFDLVEAEDERFSAFAMMDVALACSGTVTTELAMQGSAVVTGYKIGWLTWAIARGFLMKSPYISLLNVAAGREIVPEFVQTRFTADKLSHAVFDLLESDVARQDQVKAQNAALKSMGAGEEPPAQLAAAKIMELMESHRQMS